MKRGRVYKYPLSDKELNELTPWFISYVNLKDQYVEENFDLKRDAVARIHGLKAKGIDAELWTRRDKI